MAGIFAPVWNKIAHVWDTIVHAGIAFSDALVTGIASLGGPALDIIAQAVAGAERTGQPGSDKFAIAKSEILSNFEAAGITASLNIVHGAIEAAVAQLGAAKTAAS